VALRGCAPTPYYIENSVSILFPHCGYLYLADRVRSILVHRCTEYIARCQSHAGDHMKHRSQSSQIIHGCYPGHLLLKPDRRPLFSWDTLLVLVHDARKGKFSTFLFLGNSIRSVSTTIYELALEPFSDMILEGLTLPEAFKAVEYEVCGAYRAIHPHVFHQHHHITSRQPQHQATRHTLFRRHLFAPHENTTNHQVTPIFTRAQSKTLC
jgi:hypothetical protein